ncbi:hypothetical protein DENSPDRAFT_887313 [Dentipellis sp. KUC8613]|nr:hypothetical protein DENSPDRAFT_887313 [Dentipellis sp. KUC8613]
METTRDRAEGQCHVTAAPSSPLPPTSVAPPDPSSVAPAVVPGHPRPYPRVLFALSRWHTLVAPSCRRTGLRAIVPAHSRSALLAPSCPRALVVTSPARRAIACVPSLRCCAQFTRPAPALVVPSSFRPLRAVALAPSHSALLARPRRAIARSLRALRAIAPSSRHRAIFTPSACAPSYHPSRTITPSRPHRAVAPSSRRHAVIEPSRTHALVVPARHSIAYTRPRRAGLASSHPTHPDRARPLRAVRLRPLISPFLHHRTIAPSRCHRAIAPSSRRHRAVVPYARPRRAVVPAHPRSVLLVPSHPRRPARPRTLVAPRA